MSSMLCSDAAPSRYPGRCTLVGFLFATCLGMLALPALSQTKPLALGTPDIEGHLKLGDPLGNGKHVNVYDFDVEAEPFGVRLQSDAFDTFLVVTSPSGRRFENDDAGSTSESHVAVGPADAEAGVWQIHVTTYEEGEVGAYRLSVRGLVIAPEPERQPLSLADGPHVISDFLSEFQMALPDGRLVDWHPLDTDGQPFSAQAEGDFDTFLIVEAPDGTRYENDDHEGSTSKSFVRAEGPAGRWRIGATSFSSGATGPYRLYIEVSTQPSSPESARTEPSSESLRTGPAPPVPVAAVPQEPRGLRGGEPTDSPRIVVETGHSAPVTGVAFSPDGRLLLSASGDQTVILWETSTGKQVRRFQCSAEHADVYQAAFTAEGAHALVACADRNVHVFNLATGEDVRQFYTEPSYLVWTFAQTGGYVVVGGNETAPIYEIATGRRVGEIGTDQQITAASTAKDGPGVLIATAPFPYGVSYNEDSGGRVELWDLDAREVRTSFEAAPNYPVYQRHIAMSPDGRRAVASSNSVDLVEEDEGEVVIQVWDAASGAEVWRLTPESAVNGLTFTPDGRHLVAALTGTTLPDDNPLTSITTGARTVLVYDAATGREVRGFDGHEHAAASVAISPAGRHVASGGDDGLVRVWAFETGALVRTLGGSGQAVEYARLAPGGAHLLTGHLDKRVRLWDINEGRVAHSTLVPEVRDHAVFVRDIDRWVDAVGFSQDGTTVSLGEARVWDAATGQVRSGRGAGRGASPLYILDTPIGESPTVRSDGETVSTLRTDWDFQTHAFSADGAAVIGAAFDARVWDTATGEPVLTLPGEPDGIDLVALSTDGRFALTANGDFSIGYWSIENAMLVHTLRGHWGPVHSLSFTLDGRLVLTGSQDGSTRLWSRETGDEVAALYGIGDGGWAIVAPDGRFDMLDLERVAEFGWVMPDDPLTPLPIEAFMRDYYEPRLLPRLLAGEAFPDIGSLLERNRVQPRVEIIGVAPEASGGGARVTVRAEGVEREYGGEARASGVHDVRLFRNGQLVAWEDGEVVAETGAWERTFAVPLASGADSVRFSAYAFNVDRVKSTTAYADFAAPEDSARAKRAYVVSLGVDAFEDPAWDLQFAAADARAYQRALPKRLRASGEADEVVSISLVSAPSGASGEDLSVAEGPATKAALRAVLRRLAGDTLAPEDEEALARVPGADALRPATPDDVVIVTASTHGYADSTGVFYLLPSDIPASGGRRITPELLAKSISSDEISAWVRGIDAGESVLIVDACNAAGAVEGTGFKPGPMGARGLGQLAFDKGMRVLTATQAAAPALESAATGRGLLTFALVDNGLVAGQADGASGGAPDGQITLAEWLAYGVARVPSLSDEIRRGAVETFGAPVTRSPDVEGEALGTQTPALFDFRRSTRELVVASGVERAAPETE